MTLNENGTVRLAGIKPEIILALMLIEPVFNKYGIDLVITAGTEQYYPDGRKIHMTGSLHDTGYAVDLRSRDVPDACWTKFTSDLKASLTSEYDLLYEENHFHLEFDPS